MTTDEARRLARLWIPVLSERREIPMLVATDEQQAELLVLARHVERLAEKVERKIADVKELVAERTQLRAENARLARVVKAATTESGNTWECHICCSWTHAKGEQHRTHKANCPVAALEREGGGDGE